MKKYVRHYDSHHNSFMSIKTDNDMTLACSTPVSMGVAQTMEDIILICLCSVRDLYVHSPLFPLTLLL